MTDRTTTESTPTREALMHEDQALAREHARLALDDPDGDRIRLVKARRAAIPDALQDLALATEETQRRAAEAEATARAQREAEHRAQATALRAALRARAAAIDARLVALKGDIQEFQRVERDLAATVATLTPPVLARPNRLVLPGAVTWALAEVLGLHIPRPHHALRKPLSELVGHEQAEPSGAPPEEDHR